MKLIRFGKTGKEKPGVELPTGQRIDVSGFGSDYDEIFLVQGVLINSENGFLNIKTLALRSAMMKDWVLPSDVLQKLFVSA